MRDSHGCEVDLHAITLDGQANGVLGPAENGDAYPVRALTGQGLIRGTVIRCIAAEDLVAVHAGYDLDVDDWADVIALCKRFGIEVPGEMVAAQARLLGR